MKVFSVLHEVIKMEIQEKDNRRIHKRDDYLHRMELINRVKLKPIIKENRVDP